MTVSLGREIEGKYDVLSILGEGGMGAVYKVRHRYLDEIQIIKVIREKFQADENLKARFLREAKTAKKLRHPNIAEVIDYNVTAEGMAYIVMEFIEGVNLRDVMTRAGNRLEYQFVVDVGVQTLAALAYLHSKGFVHRDISPDNIMLTKQDGRPVVKLIDLGIAKSVEQAGTSNLTMDGKFVGKVQYASPEQFSGSEHLDQRSDLYSLGVALYEMMTGVPPIGGTGYQAIIAGHLMYPPKPFSETDPHRRVPEPVRESILKSLEKKPEDRYANADDFAAALRAAYASQGAGGSAPTLATAMPDDGKTAIWPPTTANRTAPASDTPTVANATSPAATAATTRPNTSSDTPTIITAQPAATTTSPDAATMVLSSGQVTQHDMQRTAAAGTMPGLTPRKPWRIAVAALVLIVLGSITAYLWRTPAAPEDNKPPVGDTAGRKVDVVATGELVIKALPWGEVVEVMDSNGRNRVPKRPFYTPAALTLEPGTYRVVLSNSISQRTVSVKAEVKAAGVEVCEAELDTVDAASYLKQVMR
jgi:serine/threonine-protein kinase